MRIAVLASPVAPLQPAQIGGAQSVAGDLATGLAARGHAVRLYCAEGSKVDGVQLVTVPLPLDAAAALVVPAGNPPPPAPGVDAAIAAMYRAVEDRGADVISQHAFDARAFGGSRGIPALYTLHLPPMVPAVVAAARAVDSSNLATVSLACAEMWRQAGVEVGRVLANGVADIAVPDAPVERCALVAGRISPEKGIDLALAAIARAGLGARVAGARYGASYQIDLAGAEHVGALTRTQLRRLMARSAVTVCAPRWDEPFGLVAAEAQMAGCPVAAFARGGLPEVVEDGVSGHLAGAGDVEALAEAIEKCLRLDRVEVRASARRRLGIDLSVDRYEAALRAVAA